MMPNRCYLICTSPRSGSTLLSEGLHATNVAGYPKEWFAALAVRNDPWTAAVRAERLDRSFEFQLLVHSAPSDTEYVRRIGMLGSSANGVFGAKLHLGQVLAAKKCLRGHLSDRTSRLDELLSRTFPQLSYIWLKRRDKVAQGISMYKAAHTGEYARVEGGSAAQVAVPYDFSAIREQVEKLGAEERVWGEIFRRCGIDPLIVHYEDFVATYAATIESILQHLRIEERPVALPKPRLQRQADQLSAEWHRKFSSEYPCVKEDPLEILTPWVDEILH